MSVSVHTIVDSAGVPMCSSRTPMVQITSENSEICDRFTAGTTDARMPMRFTSRAGVMVKNRDTTTKTESRTAVTTVETSGRLICVPSATKNNVMKKSRRLTTFAVTSRLYGKVERATPATSAPISLESPSPAETSTSVKHHAKAPSTSSSGRVLMERNSTGSTKREARSAAITTVVPFTSCNTSTARLGVASSGCSARKRIAQMSWNTRMPSVSRPGSPSSSDLS